MPVILIAAAISAVAAIAGAAIGAAASSAEREQQEKWLQEATDAYGNIDIPKFHELIVRDVPPTELARIQTDPKFKEATFAADDALRIMAEKGGLTLGDKAALTSIRNKIAQSESAGRLAIEDQMAARGQLGSGAQLAMQLQNQQGAAQRASDEGAQMAGAAEARAYQAVLDRARNAQTGQAQEWNQAAQVASAQDAINKQNQQMSYNTQFANNAQAQQNFQNQIELARGRSGRADTMANYHANQGSNIQQSWNQGAAGIGNVAGAAYSAYNTPASPGVSGVSGVTPVGQSTGYTAGYQPPTKSAPTQAPTQAPATGGVQASTSRAIELPVYSNTQTPATASSYSLSPSSSNLTLTDEEKADILARRKASGSI